MEDIYRKGIDDIGVCLYLDNNGVFQINISNRCEDITITPADAEIMLDLVKTAIRIAHQTCAEG